MGILYHVDTTMDPKYCPLRKTKFHFFFCGGLLFTFLKKLDSLVNWDIVDYTYGLVYQNLAIWKHKGLWSTAKDHVAYRKRILREFCKVALSGLIMRSKWHLDDVGMLDVHLGFHVFFLKLYRTHAFGVYENWPRRWTKIWVTVL